VRRRLEPDQNNLDTFSLKILILLLCKDSFETKCELLANHIIGPDGRECSHLKMIDSNNKRLIKSLKLIFYFAEILPKKFYNNFSMPNDIKIETTEQFYWSSLYVKDAE